MLRSFSLFFLTLKPQPTWRMAPESALALAGASEQWKWWNDYYVSNKTFVSEV